MAGLTENFFAGVKSGLTLRWVGEVWELYARTVYLSIGIALASLAVTLVLGVPAALVIVRAPLKGRSVLNSLLLAPMVVPGVVLGTSLYVFQIEAEIGDPKLESDRTALEDLRRRLAGGG